MLLDVGKFSVALAGVSVEFDDTATALEAVALEAVVLEVVALDDVEVVVSLEEVLLVFCVGVAVVLEGEVADWFVDAGFRST